MHKGAEKERTALVVEGGGAKASKSLNIAVGDAIKLARWAGIAGASAGAAGAADQKVVEGAKSVSSDGTGAAAVGLDAFDFETGANAMLAVRPGDLVSQFKLIAADVDEVR